MKAEEIVELILDAARESRVLTGGIYKDEPIIRTGKQAFGTRASTSARASQPTRAPQPAQTRPQPAKPQRSAGQGSLWDAAIGLGEIVSEAVTPVPEPIAQMRRLARSGNRWAFSYADPTLFYNQAHFIASYTDDYPYRGTFEKYYPTYEDMTTAQLRGYFTWRTHWRAGEAPAVPLSFLFVHVYELLCGVGTQPGEQCLAELERLRDAYGDRPGNEALRLYLGTWISDYVIYHGLDAALLGERGQGSPLERAVAELDRAEKALLASKAPGVWNAALAGVPTEKDLTFALAAASRYRLERSKLFSDRFDVLAECCCRVFARMVDHCHRRRKRGFTEGLFGEAQTVPYAMFRSAVFFDPSPHPDCLIRLQSGVEFTCRNGRWARYRPHKSGEASAELGDILHETDRVLREQLGGYPELKAREVPKYVRSIVAEEVSACLDRRAAEEAARVVIDRSVLGGIRAAAVRTRESLLVDEERAETPETTALDGAAGSDRVTGTLSETDRNYVPSDFGRNVVPIVPAAASSGPLPADDAAYLRALLDGQAAEAPGGMASLVVDRINEALFDLIGDTVIEFEGDTPRIVEDYADDVREVLG